MRKNKYVSRDKLKDYAKLTCRTVYLPVFRSSGYEDQNAFDFPDPAVLDGDRGSSTVAPQALFLMNSPLVHSSSSGLAKAMLAKTDGASAPDRAGWMVLHLLGRPATDAERERGAAFVGDYAPDDPPAAWAAFARALFASNEFLYIE